MAEFTAVLIYLNLLLLGSLITAWTVISRYKDQSAAYPLFSVRDKLVRAVVFDGLDRNDPWFDALYKGVNIVLSNSNFVSGPEGWDRAHAIGTMLAQHPDRGVQLPSPPDHGEPPDCLKPLIQETRDALSHLMNNHVGMWFQINAERRVRLRQQRAEAKQLDSTLANACLG